MLFFWGSGGGRCVSASSWGLQLHVLRGLMALSTLYFALYFPVTWEVDVRSCRVLKRKRMLDCTFFLKLLLSNPQYSNTRVSGIKTGFSFSFKEKAIWTNFHTKNKISNKANIPTHKMYFKYNLLKKSKLYVFIDGMNFWFDII